MQIQNLSCIYTSSIVMYCQIWQQIENVNTVDIVNFMRHKCFDNFIEHLQYLTEISWICIIDKCISWHCMRFLWFVYKQLSLLEKMCTYLYVTACFLTTIKDWLHRKDSRCLSLAIHGIDCNVIGLNGKINQINASRLKKFTYKITIKSKIHINNDW